MGDDVTGVADRVLGGLLGVACGDALGATTEFEPRPRPAHLRVTEVVGGGVLAWPPGAPTDDTDQTLAVLEAYVTTGAGSTDELLAGLATNLVAWLDGRPPDIGATTLSALSALRQHGDWTRSGVAAPEAQANGSLMRCLPTALVRPDAALRRAEAAAVSRVTHASPVCVDACVAYTDVAAALVAGAAPADAIAATADRPAPTAAVDEVLRRSPDRPLPFAPGGWVLTALDIAVWAIQQPRSAADLVLDVINMGSDADTNGAIAGGLLGCRDGAAAWPARWVAVLTTAARIGVLAHELVALRAGPTATAGSGQPAGPGKG